MITLQELCRYLDQLLQSAIFDDFCPNGLQIEGCQHIYKIATAVSASLATIEAAIDCGAQALIVHHGIFWNRDNYEIKGTKKEKIHSFLKNDLSLLAYHLPLDAHQQLGNNWKAAQEMGWKDLQPFCFHKGVSLGVKGVVEEMSCQSFQNQLKNYYQHEVHCALGGPSTIKRVGLISGGAYKHIYEAAAQRLDCYVTGSFDEPVWHAAYEEKINFFAMGHSATEKVGPRALGEYLKKQLGIECQFIDIPNPF